MIFNKYLIGMGIMVLIVASEFMKLRPREEPSVQPNTTSLLTMDQRKEMSKNISTPEAANVNIQRTLASDKKMMKSKDILDCNKHSINSFSSCLAEHFPVGSSYVELKHFLHEQGFKQPKDDSDLKNNKFYFFWWANDLSNYKIVVRGRLDKDLRILEIKVS